MGGWLKKLVHVNGGAEARGLRKNATQFSHPWVPAPSQIRGSGLSRAKTPYLSTYGYPHARSEAKKEENS